MIYRRLVVRTGLFLALLTACQSPSATSTAALGEVPAALNSIEEQAEDIIDQLPREAWEVIADDTSTIGEAWAEYASQATSDGAPAAQLDAMASALDALDAASAAHDAAATAQAANDVSRVTVELFALYETTHPVDIGRLDVIGRQIVIDAQKGDLAGAGEQVAEVRRIWNGLRSEAGARSGGSEVAAAMDANLEALVAAGDAGDADALVQEATTLLELVDDMEQLY